MGPELKSSTCRAPPFAMRHGPAAEFGKWSEVSEPQASLSGLASSCLGPEEEPPGRARPLNSLVGYVHGGPTPRGSRSRGPGARKDSASPHSSRQADPATATHPCLPRDTVCAGTVPPPQSHSSQNSGEVSEPPQPQLPPPLRTAGTGPFSSQQPRHLETGETRGSRDLFLLSCQVFLGGGGSQTSDCLCFLTLSGVFLKWLFVILPRLTHLSQQPWKTLSPALLSAERLDSV